MLLKKKYCVCVSHKKLQYANGSACSVYIVDPVQSPLVVYCILRTIKKSNNCTWFHVQKKLYFL